MSNDIPVAMHARNGVRNIYIVVSKHSETEFEVRLCNSINNGPDPVPETTVLRDTDMNRALSLIVLQVKPDSRNRFIRETRELEANDLYLMMPGEPLCSSQPPSS